jgi:hypothetical protein
VIFSITSVLISSLSQENINNNKSNEVVLRISQALLFEILFIIITIELVLIG